MRFLQRSLIRAGVLSAGLASSLVVGNLTQVAAQQTLPTIAAEPPDRLRRLPPGIISDADGRTFVGTIGGLDGWTIPGSDAVFFTAPDGRTTIAGYAFSPDGTDIGAQYSGKEAAQLSKLLQRQADIEGNLAVEGGEEGDASIATEPKAPTVAASQADIEEARALLEKLVAGIRDAKSPDEFRTVWRDWLTRIPPGEAAAAQAAIQQLVPHGTEQGSTSTIADPLAALGGKPQSSDGAAGSIAAPRLDGPPPVSLAPTGARNQALPLPAAPPAQAQLRASDAPSPESVLTELKSQTFWFQVGNNAAPAVYAVIDPECPHCARAMLNLKERVESGKLKLRIALAPIISESSRAMVAAIVNDKEPAVKFWEHEIDKAYGQSKLVPVTDFNSLSPAGKYALQATDNNIQFLVRNDIRGVPFFAWNEADGAKVHFGVPREDAFDKAVADDYDGNNLSAAK